MTAVIIPGSAGSVEKEIRFKGKHCSLLCEYLNWHDDTCDLFNEHIERSNKGFLRCSDCIAVAGEE